MHGEAEGEDIRPTRECHMNINEGLEEYSVMTSKFFAVSPGRVHAILVVSRRSSFVVCPSACRLSICNVGSPYSGD